MPRIGVLGCGGAVGREVAQLFSSRGYQTLGAQRSQADFDLPGFEWLKTDIHSKDDLKRFCDLCDLVVNCSGPSFWYSEAVAAAADAAFVRYIDVFGTKLFESYKESAPVRVPHILGAGNVPGLPGVVVRYIAGGVLDKVERANIWCGGIDYCGYGSAVDTLASAFSGYGVSGHCLMDGLPMRETILDERSYRVVGFPNEVFIYPFLTNELSAVAARCGIPEVHSYNVVFDKSTKEIMLRLGSALASDNCEATLDRSAKELVRWCEKSMFGVEPSYVIVVEAEGMHDGQSAARRVVISMIDSFKTTAFMAVKAAESVLSVNFAPGAYWAWEFLDPASVLKDLCEENSGASFRVTTFEPGAVSDNEEEGEV